MRNLPCFFDRGVLLDYINAQGLEGQYDFVYLPMDFHTKQSVGYAFINFTSTTAALLFRAAMDGFSAWPVPSHKVARVQWSQTQGYDANVQNCLKSRAVKNNCPEFFLPAVFAGGRMMPFPRLETSKRSS